MVFPRGKGRDTGFTHGCAAAELLVTQSALSAFQVVSLGLYSHHLINPSDSLILQSRNAFPPDWLLPSQGTEHLRERGAGGGAGQAQCQARRQPPARDFPAGRPGFLFALPAAPRQPPGFRHSLIRTFLWVQHRTQLFPLPAERCDRQQACRRQQPEGRWYLGRGLLQAFWCGGSHTRWLVFNGTLAAFVPQAARETAAEQEAAELPLPPARGGFSQQ